MSTPILTTKLYVPAARTELVSRPRLTARLDESLARVPSLALISAPPGFGKTTLVSSWIERLLAENGQAQAVSWLSLDEQDNDPTRFWSYVIAALDRVHTGVGGNAMAMLQPPQPPPVQEILVSLLNNLATVPDRFTLVLDDYHIIEQPAIHEGLTFFLDHLPPQLHLVMISRTDPPLPLTRFRVRHQLTELRDSDLRFTPDEAATFLNQIMGLDLSPDDIVALEGRTEGWVAGLQLAALSMRGRNDVQGFVEAFTGSHRYVIDYLAEEVLSQQPDHIRDFLLRTSILERLHGPLCDAVLDCADETPFSPDFPTSQSVLEHLEQANLFLVPLDDQRQWYRYHHLFADFLRGHLYNVVGKDAVAALHYRASIWYEQNDAGSEAVSHALQSRNYEQALPLIERISMEFLTRGEAQTFIKWTADLPEIFIKQRPRLSLSLAWAYIIINQFDRIEELLSYAETSLANPAANFSDDGPRLSRLEMEGEVAAIRSMTLAFQGQIQAALTLAEEALEKIASDDYLGQSILKMHLGNIYEDQGQFSKAISTLTEAIQDGEQIGSLITMLTASNNLADTHMHLGQLNQAVQVHRDMLVAFEKSDPKAGGKSSFAGRTYLGLAEVAREQNRLNEAMEHIETAFEIVRKGSNIFGTYELGHLIQARILQAKGNLDGALASIQTAREGDPLFANLWLDAIQVRLWISQGDLASAANWAETCGLEIGDDRSYFQFPGEYSTLARIFIAQEQFDSARQVLDHIFAYEKTYQRKARLLEIFILQSVLAYAEGNVPDALQALGQALPLGQSGGYVRLFLDEGQPIIDLLQRLSTESSPHQAYITRLLEAAQPIAATPIISNRSTSQTTKLVEPLSEREIEVLHLIADGLSNQEIADRLVIAEGTVKKHIHNIFGKLGVRRRTQVVLRARELGLLEDI